MNTSSTTIGFIGLGVMGEPMCRNLASRSGHAVRGFDRDTVPLQRLAEHGVVAATSVREAAEHASVVFLSLPSGDIVRQVCEGTDGLLGMIRAGQSVVDLSTSPVDVTRELAARFAARGADFIDAPVARTRAAAEAGTLAIMVGAEAEGFARIRPLLETFASDIIHCGPVGCGQVVKILNNMVLFETVVALAEAKAIGERSGVEPAVLFDALSKGSADSFALRNHGLKSMLPETFPERAFSVIYARKDLTYALRLAEQTGIDARGAANVDWWFDKAIESGLGEQYHPVVSRLIGA